MIDSIVLYFPNNTNPIFDKDLFYNHSFTASHKFQKYMPKVSMLNKFGNKYLKVDFSAPKLLFGNNLDELEDTDFDNVVTTLHERLLLLGVSLGTSEISNAAVLSFHPSKNILLENGYTATSIIKDLQTINLTKRLDLQDTQYRNGGEIIQFYSKSHAFAIYDKIADVKKGNGRNFDKAAPAYQDLLAKELKKKPLEVLRLEVRLQTKEKMNQVMEFHGYGKHPKFKDIFNKQLCKTIVKDYWRNVTQDNLVLLETPNNPDLILRSILASFPRMKPQKACSLAFVILYGKTKV